MRTTRRTSPRHRPSRALALGLLAMLAATFLPATAAHAADLDGVWHDPYGVDDQYSTEPTERSPRDPMAGDEVTIHATTWPVASNQTVWVTWTKNGIDQTPIGGAWEHNSGNNSYWSIALGAFARGDQVAYTVHADVDGGNARSTGPHSFSTTSWSSVTEVVGWQDNSTSVDVTTGDSAGDFTPRIRFAMTGTTTFTTQIAPTGNGLDIAGTTAYAVADEGDQLTISTADLVLRVQKSPYRLSVYQGDGTTLLTQQYDPTQFRNLAWASDGSTTVTKVEDHFLSPAGERFEGFGERYDRLDHRGSDVLNYVYNQYQDQGSYRRTYYSAPFFTNSAGYGIHVSSTRNAVFNIATHRDDMAGFTVDTGGALDSTLTYEFYAGSPAEVVDGFTAATGRPQLPPKWAFGLWASANEWDTQAEVVSWADQVRSSGIPHSALVLEQWSDEATFYLWNGATYTPTDGSTPLTYDDLSFPAGGPWQDPRQMVSDLHEDGVRVLLWQIPVLKENFGTNPPAAPQQHLNDVRYAVAQGHLVLDRDDHPYRIPTGQWFGDSTVPDFTSRAATEWWMSKRQYLLGEVGVDGFKTDGSEALFGRDLRVADGRRGDEMHNAYPNEYTAAYNTFVQSATSGDGVIFSRAGTSGGQSSSIFWAGDQASTFTAFQEAVRAGQSIGQSGVPYWAWDMAGFTGPFPSAELYLRAAAMSTFSPIMQYHSEKADPSPSEARTPWNVQARTGDSSVVPTFRRFADVRMNLIPYLYTEADNSARTGAPMMRAMSYAYPADPVAAGHDQQYLLGSQLLVAPITTQGQTTKEVYLPEGEWYDFWNGGRAIGAGTKLYNAGLDTIPVYASAGAVIPLDLNASYELGGSIDNGVDHYDNLVFRIYPAEQSTYDYFEDSAGAHRSFQVSADRQARTVTVGTPALTTTSTLQISGTEPASVTVAGAQLARRSGIADLIAASTGWYWDPVQQLTYVKIASGTATRQIVLAGIDKAAYEAEFATHTNVSTNNDHAGYTGTGFVDGFETPGDAVELDVWAEQGGPHELLIRYGNGAPSSATRTVRIDSGPGISITLPARSGWADWGTVAVPVDLSAGRHTIRVEYAPDDAGGVNLDSLALTRS